jgi:hypothetical protein
MTDMWKLSCYEQGRGFLPTSIFTSVDKALDYVHAWYMYNHYRGEVQSCGLKKIRWQSMYENDLDRRIDGYYEDEQLQGKKQKYHLWRIEKVTIDPDWIEVCSIEESLKWAASVGLPSRKDMFEFDPLPTYTIAGPTESNTYTYKYYSPMELSNRWQDSYMKRIEDMIKRLVDGVNEK